MNPNSKNETKSDIFQPDMFKSEAISFFLPKNIKVFQWLTRSKFFSFMIKVNSNNGNETKSDNFPRDIFKPDIINFLTKNIKAIQ